MTDARIALAEKAARNIANKINAKFEANPMTVSPEKIAEMIERLRPRHTADEPLAQAVVSNSRDERRAAVSAYLIANNALKSEAVAMLTTLRSQLSGITDELERTERNRGMWKGQVERQAAVLTALRLALKPFADCCDAVEFVHHDYADNIAAYSGLRSPTMGELRAARSALSEGGTP